MDIKSKKFSENKGIKALAFILCVVFFIGSLVGAGLALGTYSNIDFEGNIDDLLLNNSYQESAAFQREFDWKVNEILYMLHEFKSEEYIKSGEFISKERMDRAIENLFYSMDFYGRDYYDPAVREGFIKDHADEILKLKETMIIDQLREFESYKKRLFQINGYTYYATDGTYFLTNIDNLDTERVVDAKEFMNKPAYIIYQNEQLIKVPGSLQNANGGMKNYDTVLEDRFHEEYNQDLKVYFAFDESYLQAKEKSFTAAKAELVKWIPVALICGLLSLTSLIYLIVVTGRKDEEGNRPYHPLDRIFTEFQLLVIALPFFFGGFLFINMLTEIIESMPYYGKIVSSDPFILYAVLAAVTGLVSASIGLLFILSCIRNLKAGRFLKNSLVYKVFMAIYNGIKSIYHGGRVMTKVVLIVLAICLLSATVVLAPVVAILIIVLAPKWVRKYGEIKKGVDEVKSGNLTYKIPLSGEGELDQLAQGINQVSQASNIAVQNELKNQRLKTELISNVSHDLKTPLTSIITYIDLLKKEGLDSVDAPKYLDILDEKSNRLQKLTEDLFDAAKASSGAIPVKFEQVDMLALINQGLGEMTSRIESSGLDFKITANNDKYLVRADGQLLWRVVENLLTNVLKYALEGSRVYIDLYEQGSSNGKGPMVVLEIKNISKAPLNIDADELMERFKCGDESRTTEGSGLGLAIAKDLIKLQDGWFEIKIDGDLFKAVVLLSKIN
ncbi:MAG: HAMP domain-containing sensor histidine kinase [Eubacteriales bacterium]|nr:HAMP domain-containing sensor histidine kinase [Eubacteriales bacterium]